MTRFMKGSKWENESKSVPRLNLSLYLHGVSNEYKSIDFAKMREESRLLEITVRY